MVVGSQSLSFPWGIYLEVYDCIREGITFTQAPVIVQVGSEKQEFQGLTLPDYSTARVDQRQKNYCKGGEYTIKKADNTEIGISGIKIDQDTQIVSVATTDSFPKMSVIVTAVIGTQ